MKIIFAGTPVFAAAALDELIRAGSLTNREAIPHSVSPGTTTCRSGESFRSIISSALIGVMESRPGNKIKVIISFRMDDPKGSDGAYRMIA